MKQIRQYRFLIEKNAKLKAERGISFNEVVYSIEQGNVLDILNNDKVHYKHQGMYVVEINDYAYVVPFIASHEEIFLITIYPSRTMTKRYLRRKPHVSEEE